MPKRTDLKKILVIGAGPIVIGQACEFDYSGSQACKALKEEGYEVVLVNSNPATIMTDPEMADRTYIEPITFDILEKIIEKERPDALLPTLGGQTGLNVATELAERGVLKRFKVELIGANLEAIKKAEDRNLFKEAMKRIGVPTPRSEIAYSIEDAVRVAHELGFPVIIRPAYTLGGTGGGIAYNIEELKNIVEIGLEASRINQALIEESVIGWKEYELEVMRDKKDNVVIICSIENLDPMGIHTGDSITVAPAQTLTDKEYQVLRDASIKIIREIGVETGGSNIQFAVNPEDGRYVAIEMNPRVSRSSALASKATGYPIAKIAAKLAIGKTLDEIPNDITKETPASFEPTLDYVVVKVPRFTFEKFPKVNKILTTQMKSVGEVMAIGRTFEEALQKAVRSLEIGKFGLTGSEKYNKLTLKELQEKLKTPTYEQLFYMVSAIQKGMSVNTISSLTRIDSWFIHKIKSIIELEEVIKNYTLESIPDYLFKEGKKFGFSDRQLASLLKSDEFSVRKKRKKLKILPVFKMVDTCAAEFEAKTPYFYSTYEDEDEVIDCRMQNAERGNLLLTSEIRNPQSNNPQSAIRNPKSKVAIIGAGANRIGQ
ncbi:MAG TPA: carbamoyl-phosphate synthase large subunit [Methanosarcinales archaeon]|nr:carbamoyl-phosphate synthase large subunit [Methanosarcinales archaeon]